MVKFKLRNVGIDLVLKKGFLAIYFRTDFWKVGKGFGKWIYKSGFVEKEEFYDKFRKMVFKPTAEVPTPLPPGAVAFGIV